MLDFVRLLKERCQSILNHTPERTPIHLLVRDRLSSICLSEAFLEKGECLKRHPGLPVQIAVIGPTQSGKSSVVNLLLSLEVAGVSPLAGFTTYPQGFALGLLSNDRAAIEHFFHDFERIEQTATEPAPSGTFSLRAVSTDKHPYLHNCVIWDTPDFDSIHSASYFNSLLRTIALVDVILLVVSKDKYADQTVWNMLSLIENLNQPTVVFLNKISQDSATALIRSFSEKWQYSRTDPVPPIVAAPFFREGIGPNKAETEHDLLIGHLVKAKSIVNRDLHHRNCSVLLNHFWVDWTDVIKKEQNLFDEWDQLVDTAASGAIEFYQRYYLNHPQHFETLKRALAELLTLLEIPGVAPLLKKTREFLTWPIRRLFGLNSLKSTGSDGRSRKSQEMQVLQRMYEHYMIHVSDAVFSKRADAVDYEHWWNEIATLIKSEGPAFSEFYDQAIVSYQNEFQLEIEKAAHRLYSKLEQQPATLNSLRATRITTDAAAVAIALKTGGIGVQDFVITPAVLSLTSFLTESALGHYMNRVEADLKQKQLKAVTTRIFEDVLNDRMKSLPARMTPGDKFNISKERLQDAETLLHEF